MASPLKTNPFLSLGAFLALVALTLVGGYTLLDYTGIHQETCSVTAACP